MGHPKEKQVTRTCGNCYAYSPIGLAKWEGKRGQCDLPDNNANGRLASDPGCENWELRGKKVGKL